MTKEEVSKLLGQFKDLINALEEAPGIANESAIEWERIAGERLQQCKDIAKERDDAIASAKAWENRARGAVQQAEMVVKNMRETWLK